MAFSVVSQQRRQDVFVRAGIWDCVPQTNAREERKERRNGSASVFEGARDGLGTRRGVVFTPVTLKFLLCMLSVCSVCMREHRCLHWAPGRLEH